LKLFPDWIHYKIPYMFDELLRVFTAKSESGAAGLFQMQPLRGGLFA
jgi:hypothetical protein